MPVRRTASTEEQRMSDSKTITLDTPTKKAIVVGIAALCLCVAGALLVVGRGSGGTSPSEVARSASGPARPGGGPTRDGTGGASLDGLRQCLRDQGVTLPDPSQRGQGQRPDMSDTTRRAFEACRQYLPERPSGSGFGGSGNGAPAMPPSGQDGQGGGGQSTGDSTF